MSAPNGYRLCHLLNLSSETLEGLSKMFASPEFRKFHDSQRLAEALAEQAARNRRAVAEEWPGITSPRPLEIVH